MLAALKSEIINGRKFVVEARGREIESRTARPKRSPLIKLLKHFFVFFFKNFFFLIAEVIFTENRAQNMLTYLKYTNNFLEDLWFSFFSLQKLHF